MFNSLKHLDRQEEMSNTVVENYATKLKWVDGKPVVMGSPMVPGPMDGRMKMLLAEAMNLPYDGHDPRYVGLTKGEALIIDLVDQASLGDKDARKEVLDRALGRPVQNIKSLSIKGSIEDFLDSIEPMKTVDVTTVDDAEDL